MKRVVIIGGGFAGINCARLLGNRPDIKVDLIDRRNYHLFQPLLYQVAMAGLSPADIAAPIRSILSDRRNVRVLQGAATGVDLDDNLLHTDFGVLPYDTLLLACGASHSYFGHPEWEEFAPGLNRQRTRSTVSVIDGGDARRFELGETRPLILLGYRFATTPNKGHAMVLSWRDVNGSVMQGAVHFPSYPAQEWRQQQTWQTPAGEKVTLGLQPHARPPADSGWVLRSQEVRVGASLSVHGVSHPLVPGKWIELHDGALRLDELRLWMGYRIDYQPLIQWMLVVSLVAIAALACYFYKRLWRPVCDRSVAHERTDSDLVARI